MAARKDHLFLDMKHFGKQFNPVHAWMDACFRTHGGLHRKIRHHKEGVEEVREMYGDGAAKAAELHHRTSSHFF